MAEQPKPAGFDEVFRQEIRAINDRRTGDPDAPAPPDLFGVCFSGGGIRSATFNLGVLQGLAAQGLLRFADYLSTVSGGGYIGGWFQALSRREGLPAAERLLKDPPPAGNDPISFLRTYSNYLAPRLGLLSTDVWVLFCIWLRNTVLNQTIFLLSLTAVLLTPLWLGNLARLEYSPAGDFTQWLIFSLAAVGIPLAAATLRIGVNVPRATEREIHGTASNAPDGDGAVMGLIAFPIFLSALMLSFQIANDCFRPWNDRNTAITASAVLLLLFGISVIRGRFLDCFGAKHAPRYAWLGFPLAAIIVAGCAGVTLALLAAVAYILPKGQDMQMWQTIAWGPPLIILVFSGGITLQIGLMGVDFSESAREWYSRLGAKLFAISIGWVVVFAITVFLPVTILSFFEHWEKAGVGAFIGWLATTFAGFQTGKSAFTAGKPPVNASVPRRTNRAVEWIAKIAPPVAACGLLVVISTASYAAIRAIAGAPLALGAASNWQLFGAALVLLLVASLISLRININLFSMNYFYKNRLVRCYLGASNPGRKPDRFTGFDPTDDILLKDLLPSRTHSAPFAIVNCTLNLNHGEQLAWQERKAESFIFTPLYCGYEPESGRAAYFPTADVMSPGGPHLGVATSVSGAAANPNWGFHTSPVTAFLMTLFNVRLGWWIGNTARPANAMRFGPRFALWYLMKEMLGLTDEKTGYLNLSDGGHFENLGLYELVRRRCKFIVASDGEQDENYVFESLGGAIRKIRVDFGYNIEISPRKIRLNDGASGVHCAVGTIDYGQGESGTLLYVKASLTGDEPWDVAQYKLSHDAFPQETTLDQFFSESQFESYRALGRHAAGKIFAHVTNTRSREDIGWIFEQIASEWRT